MNFNVRDTEVENNQCSSLREYMNVFIYRPCFSFRVLQNYLLRYGYIKPSDPKTGALRSEIYVKNAIKAFQRMAGIPQTGQHSGKYMLLLHRCCARSSLHVHSYSLNSSICVFVALFLFDLISSSSSSSPYPPPPLFFFIF